MTLKPRKPLIQAPQTRKASQEILEILARIEGQMSFIIERQKDQTQALVTIMKLFVKTAEEEFPQGAEDTRIDDGPGYIL
jgi:hypothetical protein